MKQSTATQLDLSKPAVQRTGLSYPDPRCKSPCMTQALGSPSVKRCAMARARQANRHRSSPPPLVTAAGGAWQAGCELQRGVPAEVARTTPRAGAQMGGGGDDGRRTQTGGAVSEAGRAAHHR